MIRLSLRQFRDQGRVAATVLVLVTVVLIVTRPHLAALYRTYAHDSQACFASPTCGGVTVNTGVLIKVLQYLGTGLVGLPALIGAFWGAPLIAREFEHGTHRLAWTQSVSRGRWLAIKLAVVGSAVMLGTGLLSWVITWWFGPMDRAMNNRFGVGMFAERNIAPIGYAAFAFVLGVAIGLVLRRTLAAMAVTLVLFTAIRIAFSYFVRPYLITPHHLSQALDPNSIGFGRFGNGPMTLMPNPPNLPGAWIYSTRIVNSAGHNLPTSLVKSACPNLGQAIDSPPGAAPVQAPGDGGLRDCVGKLTATYHQYTTYQPANRYWTFQWLELVIYLVAALALAGGCYWWIKRRA